jgi:hypothetical protein
MLAVEVGMLEVDPPIEVDMPETIPVMLDISVMLDMSEELDIPEDMLVTLEAGSVVAVPPICVLPGATFEVAAIALEAYISRVSSEGGLMTPTMPF